jgi:uncharacterized membrane protein YkvA (DUF1232 family)
MAEFFSFLKVVVICGALFFIVTTVLLALPQSKLRSVGLEMSKWALACGLLLLIPSPLDLAPDGVPLIGWLDDPFYLVGAVLSVCGAFKDRKRRTQLEDLEFEQLLASKRNGSPPAYDDNGDEREAA